MPVGAIPAIADGMESAHDIRAFAERIQPHLEELGIEAFVLCAYKKDAEGNVTRITIGGDGNNPAYHDGLTMLRAIAAKWGSGQA